MITFYINGQLVEEQHIAPDMTILRYLRTRKDLKGTKEGCGSGDCGACSILVGELKANSTSQEWRYRAVNGCITFLSQLHNKSVITVDGLEKQGELHPAQQAMVDKHGSQCGFCTPGIIMSLTALYENAPADADYSIHEIYDALSGNLCRCTGYKPIIDAAQTMKSYPANAALGMWQPNSNENLSEGASDHAEGQSWSPREENELKQLLADHPEARMVAGGTDIALEVTQMNRRLPKLIAINQIASLCEIDEASDYLSIGAAVTYSDAEYVLKKHFPEFAMLLDRLGSRQVRNNGTIGGNIANASPIGDTPPILIALNAEIEISGIEGSRWIALDSFYLDYKKTTLQTGEYIRAIRIPYLKDNQHLKVYKISKRIEDDISAVLMALNLTIENDTITALRSGFGGMAGIPKAGEHIEAALVGKPLSLETFAVAGEQVAKDFTPFNDVRATAEYRIQVTQGLLKKCAIELSESEKVTRIEQVQSAIPSIDTIAKASIMEASNA